MSDTAKMPSEALDFNQSIDARALYEQLRQVYEAYPLLTERGCRKHTIFLLRGAFEESRTPPFRVIRLLARMTLAIFKDEEIYRPYLLSPEGRSAFSVENVLRPHYRDTIAYLTSFGTTLDEAAGRLAYFFCVVIKALPDSVFQSYTSATRSIPLVESLLNAAELMHETLAYFTDVARRATPQNRFFYRLQSQLVDNVMSISGGTPNAPPPPNLIYPSELAKRLSLCEVARAYFADTPLLDLFLMPVPFTIPDQPYRMEHTFIIGGSGAGKTTLIQDLLLRDFARPDTPAMVIIDPKGELVGRVQRLGLFDPQDGPLKDRILIVDPSDDPPPALNMFHAADRWNRMYSDTIRHQLENQAVSNFSYIFSSVESSLTQKQSVCFTFCIRLLFRRHAAGTPTDINSLMELLNDPAKAASQSTFRPDIERLDRTSRAFFENEYYSSAFGETRGQIKARLYSIVMHPALSAMFSTSTRKLDLFDAMQRKSIVLVNANLDSPGSQAGQLFARYMVALTLNAAFERVAVSRDEWHPAFLYVDEFQLVADELKTPEMLRLAREYNLGIVLTFQDMHGRPFNDALRAAISTNTSVKYASSPEGIDINYVARDLRCDADFIRTQTKTAGHGKFACFVRGMLERPVSLSIPFGNIKPEMLMPTERHRELRRGNSDRLSERPETPAAPTGTVQAPTLEPPRTSKRRW